MEATQAQMRSAASKQATEGASSGAVGPGAPVAKAKAGSIPSLTAAARTGTAGAGVTAGAGAGQIQAGVTAVGPTGAGAGAGARAGASQADAKKPRTAVGKKAQQATTGGGVSASAGPAADGLGVQDGAPPAT